MNKKIAFVFATILGSSFVPPAAAEGDPRAVCDSVLVKDSYLEKSDTRLALAILNTLDQKSFEQMDKGGGVDLSIPVGEALIPIKGTWKNFSEKRKELNTKYQYNFDQSVSRDIAVSSTSTAAINAWSACIEKETKQALVLRPSFSDQETLVVSAYWRPGIDGKPGHVKNLTKDVITVGGKIASGTHIPVDFRGKWTDLLFTRDPRKAFYLAINLENGDAGRISFTPEFIPVSCRDCKSHAAVKLDSGQFGVGKAPPLKLTSRLRAGSYVISIKSRIQAIGEPGARPVFNYNMVSANDPKAGASVGLGGSARFTNETLHPYSASTHLQLNRDGKVEVSLSVDRSFNDAGLQVIDGTVFGESEITFTRVD